MKPEDKFKEIINLCYEEEDYPELHKEILSIENGMQGCDNDDEFIEAIGDVLDAIYTFAPDFEKYYEICVHSRH